MNHSYQDLTLLWAKGNALEKTWNAFVQTRHYRGHRITVGRSVKYLVRQRDNYVAAISFASAAWGIEQRNLVLQHIGIPPWEIRDLVINNSRFLILAKKGVLNLASRILRLATSRVADDWYRYYSIRPRIVETFVEPSRFEGTCYKAANWIAVGQTRGFKKSGDAHSNSQQPKLMFLYGLNAATRRRLFEFAAHPIRC
ncbi:MAG TPA: Druantia anti-phage system protein DruA [Chthoniobacterales bacterium]|nr:Druantia anti-phage system protein DruA [Chthoniobacterales bacterium]